MQTVSVIKSVFSSGLFLLLCSISSIAIATNTNTSQKTVLIADGMSRIGHEVASAFQADGWQVWVISSHATQQKPTAGMNFRQIDSSNPTAVKKLVHEIQTQSGRLDVLINTAGYSILGPQEAVSVAQAQELLTQNIIGPLVLIQNSLPLLRATQGSHIIDISSAADLRATPGLGMYAASNMALEGIYEALASELSPWNIQVSIIESSTGTKDLAQTAPIAANLDSYPGYKTFTKKLRTSLTSKSGNTGNGPQQIADLALSIAKNDKPDLRYQTNVSLSLADPTGNTMRDRMISLTKELYGLPGTL